MDNTAEISQPLKRPLQNGARYTGLIPRVSCEATNLGDGSNNTIEGVEFMADWITKYAWQTKKLTQKLLQEGKISKTDLQKTVNGIYSFLYRHVQYTADGSLQQLRSPACTWKQRKEGVDCKSYTIFTMSILQNLGITAAIRQVKQPGFYPEQFTHVYVVVPKNQNTKSSYYVIDATKHTNTEGVFLTAKDKIMSGLKYEGLNAPAPKATAAVSGKALENFNNFLYGLKDMGFSYITTKSINSYTQNLLSKGFDPYFIFSENGLHIRPNPKTGGIFFSVTNKQGLSADAGNAESGNADAGNAESGSSWTESIDWGKLISNAGDFFGGFSGVFSNGFDFSCFNTATSPAQAQEDINEIFIPFFKKCALIIKDSKNPNEVKKYWNWAIRFAISEKDSKRHTITGDYSKCSEKGWGIQADYMERVLGTLEKLLEYIKQKFDVNTTQKRLCWCFDIPANMTKGRSYKIMHTNDFSRMLQISSISRKSGYDYSKSLAENMTPTPPKPTMPNTTTPNTTTPNSNTNTPSWEKKRYSPTKKSQVEDSNTMVYGGLAIGALLLAWPTIAKMVGDKKPSAKTTKTPKKTKK